MCYPQNLVCISAVTSSDSSGTGAVLSIFNTVTDWSATTNGAVPRHTLLASLRTRLVRDLTYSRPRTMFTQPEETGKSGTGSGSKNFPGLVLLHYWMRVNSLDSIDGKQQRRILDELRYVISLQLGHTGPRDRKPPGSRLPRCRPRSAEEQMYNLTSRTSSTWQL